MTPFAPSRSPRRRGRPALAAVAALLLAAPLAACAAAGPDQVVPVGDTGTEEKLLDQATVPQLAWTDCQDGFECATAAVPLDYDDPQGEQIELALVRLPAGDPEQRIGSLFTNPGGPGLSGTDTLRVLAPTFPEQVRERFDVIGLDPRGVGRSTAVRCFDDPVERALTFNVIVGWPADDADQVEFVRATEDLAQRCAQRNGELLDHLSTADVARDLDLLRRAVGDERLSFHGLSYGSYLGATYASLFPDRVRAAVLDGMLEPTAYTGTDAPDGTLPWLRVGNDVATDETLGQFFELCADAGEACPLGVGGDPETRFAELLTALDTDPLVIADPTYGDFEIRADDVMILTQTALASPRTWAARATFLNDLHTRLVVDQDREAALAYFLEAQAQAAAAEPAPAQQDGRPLPNELEANFASLCTDTVNPDDAQQTAAAAAQARERAPYAANRWAWVTATCLSWAGEAEDRYTGPFTPATGEPLLVVGTVHDPNTAYRSAETFAAGLPSAGLLTLDGWGHTASFQGRSTCIDDAVAAYLVDGTMPAAGATCEPDPAGVPFAESD